MSRIAFVAAPRIRPRGAANATHPITRTGSWRAAPGVAAGGGARAATRLRYSEISVVTRSEARMAPKVHRIDPQKPEPAAIARAAEVLRKGLLVVYPTETFYGLACNPRDPAAVERLFEAKGRPDRMALPLIAGNREAVLLCARDIPTAAHRLMAAFWPGPLTLVLPAADDLPRRLLGGGHTVGVRVSSHPIAAALAVSSHGLPCSEARAR